jgi:5-methylcytosine-specific restriction endonuclease McrA
MTYERTPEHRALMSERLKGRKHDYRSASTRPEVAARIQAWWTPERREAKRQEMLKRNPQARYHGLSAKAAARLVKAAGCCQECGETGSSSRLGIHHRDRDKRNQDPSNLQVLCHRCHMREHRDEIGWAAYHAKRARKTT